MLCSLSVAASDGSSVVACKCLLSRATGTSGFGQMTVICLMTGSQSNLTNGFSCMGTEVCSISVCWYTVRAGKRFNNLGKTVCVCGGGGGCTLF